MVKIVTDRMEGFLAVHADAAEISNGFDFDLGGPCSFDTGRTFDTSVVVLGLRNVFLATITSI
jgi:hypothetical protein